MDAKRLEEILEWAEYPPGPNGITPREVMALVEEVRRLREAPPGPVTVVSGIGCDPITERAIRRAERERCIEAAGRFLTQGEEEMIAAAIRALPDAT